MLRCSVRARLSALAVPAILVLTAAPAPAQSAKPVVTNAVQVTSNPNPTRAHSSPQLARNPKTGELVIAETDVYGSFGINVHVSADDGRSWARAGDPMMKPFTWNSDYAINGPYFTMAFDPNGTLFMSFTATDPKYADRNRAERPRSVFLARSDDGGQTFSTSMAYRSEEENAKTLNNRRAMVALDPGSSSKLSVNWMQSSSGEKARSLIAYSSDGGRNFSRPVDLAEPIDQGGYQARVAIDSAGTLHAVFPGGGFRPQAPPGTPAEPPLVRPIYYRSSSDQGRTWSPVREIEPGNAGFSFNRKHLLAFDPVSRNLYLTWYGNANPRADANVDRSEIFVKVSRDQGRTWDERVVVNDDRDKPRVMHYDPGISIAANGRVDIAWYDFRNSPVPEQQFESAPFNTGGWQDVYYSSSTDRGRTWSENVRITDRLIDRNIGVWSNNVHSHYNVGIASTNDSVFFAWQDSRNGDRLTNSEDVYFASLYREPSEILIGGGSGADAPRWVVYGAFAAAGMGVAMVVAYFLFRRTSTAEVAKVRR